MDKNNDKDIMFGKAIPQIIHDIRNPLNVIIGFSSVLQIDESINDEIRSYIGNILYSGFQIEELLSNIDYYIIENLDVPFSQINIKKEFDTFLKQNNTIINEKEIVFTHNIHDSMFFTLPKEILLKIFYNLFQFSLKGIKSLPYKEIGIHFIIDETGLTLYYTDTASPIFIETDYFTYEEIAKAKRGLAPLFLEKLIKEYHGTLLYLFGKKWNDISENIIQHKKTQHGFLIHLPIQHS